MIRSLFFFRINAGTANGPTALNAFDRALLSSGCGNYNLLKVSSILPPAAVQTDSIDLKEGSLLPTAYARFIAGPDECLECDISAAVAIGIPKDPTIIGVIMEYEGVCTETDAKDTAISMVKTAMKDRHIKDDDYTIVSSATSCISTAGEYNCAFAYVAIWKTDGAHNS